MNSQRCITLVFTAVCLLVPCLAAAQAPNPGMGDLVQVLPQSGRDDNWRFVNANNSFEIENVGDPQAIRYFFAGLKQGTEGKRRIETALALEEGSRGSAGLLYGLNGDRSRYHLVTLSANGTVTLFRRDETGFRAMLEQSSSAFQPGKLNTLAIEETGSDIAIILNGTNIAGVGGDRFGFGAVGIAVVGDVRAFYNFFTDDASPSDRADAGGQSDQTRLNRPADTASQTTGGQTTNPSAMTSVKPVRIMDERGPAGPMLAYTTMIPSEWITRGGMSWNDAVPAQGCHTGAKLIWGAGTEDERYGIAFLQPINWGVLSNGPATRVCLQQDLTDAEAVMRSYFQAFSNVLQVEIKEISRPPDLQPTLEALAANWRSSSPQVRTWVDAVVITASVRSATSTNDVAFFAWTRHMEGSFNAGSFRSGDTALVVAVATPVGELEKGHPGFGVVFNNLRVSPQWKQVEAQWWRNKMAAVGGAIAARGAAQSKSVGDMMFESWQRRQSMQDAGFEKSVNSIWEVEPWQTPSGSTVLLDQNYNYAWELQNGDIVQTNDANFSPMQTFNQTGQQMQLAR